MRTSREDTIMMRSMFSGVSGLRTHQVKMDVIGNNIANVNTPGYKGVTTNFKQVFTQTVQGAGGPQGGRGGTNPQQVGLGVTVGMMGVTHTQGSTQRTDNPNDVMINGNGMFVVTDDPNFQNRYFSRAGDFTIDKLGHLVNGSGMKVLGIDYKPIIIDKTETKSATATTKIRIGSNVDSNTDAKLVKGENGAADKYIAYSTAIDVYDSLGNTNKVIVNFGEKINYKEAGGGGGATNRKGSFRAIEFANPNLTGNTVGDLSAAFNIQYNKTSGQYESIITTPAPNAAPNGSYYAKFDEAGNFMGIFAPPATVTPDVNNGEVDGAGFTEIAAPWELTLAAPGAKDVKLTLYETGKPDTSVFANLTQFAGASDAKGTVVDGNAAGVLSSYNIAGNGKVEGTFSNGEKKTLGTILLADFDNIYGMRKIGSNLFVDTANSGNPKYGAPQTGALGELQAGALEMSNVDLSQQFTDMITTQRGFQANSRVITTTDEMLQELVNLKR